VPSSFLENFLVPNFRLPLPTNGSFPETKPEPQQRLVLVDYRYHILFLGQVNFLLMGSGFLWMENAPSFPLNEWISFYRNLEA
jgi:hypothetical protein